MSSLVARFRAALVVLGAIAGVLVAAVHGPSPAELVAAVGAATLVSVVFAVAIHLHVAAPASPVLTVGHRARRHPESLDRVAEPSHPDTPGRTRSRAPGRAVPAA